LKACCNVLQTNSNLNLCFSHVHMYNSINKYIECYLGKTILQPDTTHYIIMDLSNSVEENLDHIIEFKKNGGIVILMVFDPISFPKIDIFIEKEALSKIILFDQKFKDRFPIPTFISDYFFNESIFSKNKTLCQEKKYCIIGHLVHDRQNDFMQLYNSVDLEKVDRGLYNHKNYSDIYKKIQEFNGLVIFDSGIGEDGIKLEHYNKAKAIEALMCGVNAYCKNSINTKYYNEFIIKPFDDMRHTLKQIKFNQEHIWKINKRVINELIEECKII